MKTIAETSGTPYHPIVFHIIPRILTNLDRDEDSPTYGCFDRNYWHYKVQDYSSAILQQCMLTLALVYNNNFKGNIYYNNDVIKNYAIAGIEFCTKIQHKDGSFDEYWHGERSIPSTAFTLYAICESRDILGDLPNDVSFCIKKAVDFLKKHVETEALNQEMASIAAIRYAAELLTDNKMKELATARFYNLLEKQTDEGWLSEYGGLDIGYLTVTLDYLIRYYELSKDEKALNSAKKILNTIKYFVHPDGSVGGEYCTRNTEYFMPYGIEYLKSECSIGNSLILKLMSYINQQDFLNLSWDERYMLHYLSHSFVKSLLIYTDKESEEKLPFESTFDHFLKESQIYIKSTNSYYFICNISKGGVFKVIDKNTQEVTTDCAYRIKYKGDLHVSEWPKTNKYALRDKGLTVKSYFTKKNFIQQSTLKLFLLKVASMILGFKAVELTKRLMIFDKKDVKDMCLTRNIYFEEDKIIIEDFIDVRNKTVTARLSSGLSVRHTASSRFFQINTLPNKIHSEQIKIEQNISIKREQNFNKRMREKYEKNNYDPSI